MRDKHNHTPLESARMCIIQAMLELHAGIALGMTHDDDTGWTPAYRKEVLRHIAEAHNIALERAGFDGRPIPTNGNKTMNNILLAIQRLQASLEYQIGATPTGPIRNALCDANIYLGIAIKHAQNVSERHLVGQRELQRTGHAPPRAMPPPAPIAFPDKHTAEDAFAGLAPTFQYTTPVREPAPEPVELPRSGGGGDYGGAGASSSWEASPSPEPSPSPSPEPSPSPSPSSD